MKNRKTKNLAFMSLFIAIELLMVMVPFLGFIPIGPLRATTLHIPVIIAAMTLGKEKGAGIGLVFGLSSLLINTISPTVTSFVFSPLISGSFMSALIAIIPRMLIGYVSGWIYEKWQWHRRTVVMTVSAMMGSLTNTVLVLGGIYLIFGSQYASSIGQSYQQLLPYFLGIIMTNGVLEAITGTIIAVAVTKILQHYI
ncbi:ECF transporter S component [[Clostridium] spiroforme]|nr:ECF transporter S component [Thomasclavelia spiroformis]MBM6881082.1 ECF transporter S component [Thomasclavelia spiroformis]